MPWKAGINWEALWLARWPDIGLKMKRKSQCHFNKLGAKEGVSQTGIQRGGLPAMEVQFSPIRSNLQSLEVAGRQSRATGDAISFLELWAYHPKISPHITPSFPYKQNCKYNFRKLTVTPMPACGHLMNSWPQTITSHHKDSAVDSSMTWAKMLHSQIFGSESAHLSKTS